MRHFFLLIALSCCTFLSLHAQETSHTSYFWERVGIQFDYPSTWDLLPASDDGLLNFRQGERDIVLHIAIPATNPDDIRRTYEEDNDTPRFQTTDFTEIEVLDSEAFHVNFRMNDNGAISNGMLFFFFYEGLGLDLIHTVAERDLTEEENQEIFSLLASMEAVQAPQVGNANPLIDDESTVLAQLTTWTDLRLIPRDGEILFHRRILSSMTAENGFWGSYSSGNIAMSALISWRALPEDTEFRVCSLIPFSTIEEIQNADAGTALFVSYDSESYVDTVEVDFSREADPIYERYNPRRDIYNPQEFFLLVKDGRLRIYVDGSVVVDDVELAMMPEAGTELFTGYFLDAGCVMTNVWAYTFD